MKLFKIVFTTVLLIQSLTVESKPNIIGGGCDGCELIYHGMPDQIKSISYSPAWNKEDTQKLLIKGRVFKRDGVTPQSNVIIYYWQTDDQGNYPRSDLQSSTRHGDIRGWVQSNHLGEFEIYTIRPAAYPNRDIPAHIHLVVKEPNLDQEYYLDNLVFSDDIYLTSKIKKSSANRGGSGILRLLKNDDLLVAEHRIILGLNIPNYPLSYKPLNNSGLEIGEEFPSISPNHAWGPDRGKNTCPVCRYGRYHGIMYFIGNHPDWKDIKKWLSFLEQQSEIRSQYIKVYLIYGNQNDSNKQNKLQQLGQSLNLKHLALTYVSSFQDTLSEVHLLKINPDVNNTIIIYKNRKIIHKFVDFKATQTHFQSLTKLLDNSHDKLFTLPSINSH